MTMKKQIILIINHKSIILSILVFMSPGGRVSTEKNKLSASAGVT
jgi:hypothetical protein